MGDLWQLIVQVALSPLGAIVLLATTALASTAMLLSPRRGTRHFLLGLLVLWLCAVVWIAIDASTARTALAGAVWAAAMLAIYALVFAPLVKRGSSRKTVAIVSVVLFAALLPIALISGIYIACHIGHDCL